MALLFRSNELPCGLSLCTSSCSLVAPRENKIACVSTNVLTPSWLYTRCLRVSVCTWTQVPMPRFSATDVLLTKYIWIWFLSGFSCPSQKLLKCSAAETLCGTVKAWRLYRALFFCEDVTFLTRVVVRLGLQQKFLLFSRPGMLGLIHVLGLWSQVVSSLWCYTTSAVCVTRVPPVGQTFSGMSSRPIGLEVGLREKCNVSCNAGVGIRWLNSLNLHETVDLFCWGLDFEDWFSAVPCRSIWHTLETFSRLISKME